MIDLSSLKWVPSEVGEDDFIMPDINYKILAQFLKLMSYDLKSWKELVAEFRKNRLHTILEETDKHLCGEKEDILKEVENELGEEHTTVILKLLKG